MKILKASELAIVAHCPQSVNVETGEPIRIPLCEDEPEEEFGIITEGTANCEKCSRRAFEMLEKQLSAALAVDAAHRHEYLKQYAKFTALQTRFRGLDRVNELGHSAKL